MPFFICIWGLKRLTNSCFSIQLTVWSHSDEVKGISLANFSLDFLSKPTTPRISMSGRAARLHRRLLHVVAHTHACMHAHAPEVITETKYWSVCPSISSTTILSECLGPLLPWALFRGLYSKIDNLRVNQDHVPAIAQNCLVVIVKSKLVFFFSRLTIRSVNLRWISTKAVPAESLESL